MTYRHYPSGCQSAKLTQKTCTRMARYAKPAVDTPRFSACAYFSSTPHTTTRDSSVSNACLLSCPSRTDLTTSTTSSLYAPSSGGKFTCTRNRCTIPLEKAIQNTVHCSTSSSCTQAVWLCESFCRPFFKKWHVEAVSYREVVVVF